MRKVVFVIVNILSTIWVSAMLLIFTSHELEVFILIILPLLFISMTGNHLLLKNSNISKIKDFYVFEIKKRKKFAKTRN